MTVMAMHKGFLINIGEGKYCKGSWDKEHIPDATSPHGGISNEKEYS